MAGAGPLTPAIERRNREAALRSIAMSGSTANSDARASRAKFEKLNRDFKQLQVVRLGMVSEIKNGRRFEHSRLAKDSAEIRNLATRLRSSLALLPDPAGEMKPERRGSLDAARIQDAASDLCVQISRFTENPMFRSGGVYNARHAREADAALGDVIRLATDIKASAEELLRRN